MEPITIDKSLELADMMHEAGEDMERALYYSFQVTSAMNDMIALGATDEEINAIIQRALKNKSKKLLS